MVLRLRRVVRQQGWRGEEGSWGSKSTEFGNSSLAPSIRGEKGEEKGVLLWPAEQSASSL